MSTIVLHHGLFGFNSLKVGRVKVGYFGASISKVIEGRGHRVIHAKVHPTAGIEMRAKQLKELVLEQMGYSKRVVIFAHSLGGLDARYMISRLGMDEKVAALVTITTPHRGSPYADWCCQNLGRRLAGFELMKFLNIDVQAIRDLTTESCAKFNDRIKDAPGVKYFSVSAARPWNRIPPFAMHSHKVIADREGENDGLVSIKSSTWAKHLGVWPADHWHTVNKRFVPERKKTATGDIAPYYARVLEAIAAKSE